MLIHKKDKANVKSYFGVELRIEEMLIEIDRLKGAVLIQVDKEKELKELIK